MRILWYVFTAVFGLFGLLALIRTVERIVSGEGLIPIQLLISFVMLFLAVICMQRARAAN